MIFLTSKCGSLGSIVMFLLWKASQDMELGTIKNTEVDYKFHNRNFVQRQKCGAQMLTN
jgi:hypothetical protein